MISFELGHYSWLFLGILIAVITFIDIILVTSYKWTNKLINEIEDEGDVVHPKRWNENENYIAAYLAIYGLEKLDITIDYIVNRINRSLDALETKVYRIKNIDIDQEKPVASEKFFIDIIVDSKVSSKYEGKLRSLFFNALYEEGTILEQDVSLIEDKIKPTSQIKLEQFLIENELLDPFLNNLKKYHLKENNINQLCVRNFPCELITKAFRWHLTPESKSEPGYWAAIDIKWRKYLNQK